MKGVVWLGGRFWFYLRRMCRREWSRFANRWLPKIIILPPHHEARRTLKRVEPAERVYYLRLQVVEHNGNFVKEVSFRNCWDTPEQAEAWLNGLVSVAGSLMRQHGTHPEIETGMKLVD